MWERQIKQRSVIYSNYFKSWVICEEGKFCSPGLGWRPFESHRQEKFQTEDEAIIYMEKLNADLLS